MTPLDKPKRILVVDDERDIRSLVERYLKREGFRAYGAENGDAMITILKQNPSTSSFLMSDFLEKMVSH